MRFNGWTLLSLALLLIGVAFWISMSSSAGDVGTYSVGMTLVAFGALGALASLLAPRRV